MNVKIKKLYDNAVTPTYGTEYSAGADLYAYIDEPITVFPGRTEKIGTGISLELPKSTCGLVYARSGLATKKGLRLANSVGVIDSDYRGELIVPLYNDSDEIQIIFPMDRIAQLVITPYYNATFEVVDELDTTVRGEGGFGSTGIGKE